MFATLSNSKKIEEKSLACHCYVLSLDLMNSLALPSLLSWKMLKTIFQRKNMPIEEKGDYEKKKTWCRDDASLEKDSDDALLRDFLGTAWEVGMLLAMHWITNTPEPWIYHVAPVYYYTSWRLHPPRPPPPLSLSLSVCVCVCPLTFPPSSPFSVFFNLSLSPLPLQLQMCTTTSVILLRSRCLQFLGYYYYHHAILYLLGSVCCYHFREITAMIASYIVY